MLTGFISNAYEKCPCPYRPLAASSRMRGGRQTKVMYVHNEYELQLLFSVAVVSIVAGKLLSADRCPECLAPCHQSVGTHCRGGPAGWPVGEVAVAEQAVGDGSCSLKVTAPEQRSASLGPNYPWCLNITCRGNGDNSQYIYQLFVVSAARSNVRQLPCRCLLPAHRREAASTAD